MRLNINRNLTLTSKCKDLHFDVNVKLILMLSFIIFSFLCMFFKFVSLHYISSSDN